jgi:hypothetical protein
MRFIYGIAWGLPVAYGLIVVVMLRCHVWLNPWVKSNLKLESNVVVIQPLSLAECLSNAAILFASSALLFFGVHCLVDACSDKK